MNVARLLVETAKRRADLPALADGARPVATYGELGAAASRLATELRSDRRTKRGDRVVLFMSNHSGYIAYLFATWMAGLVAVPVNAKLHYRELAFILSHCDPDRCVVDEEHAATVDAAVRESGARTRIVVAGPGEYRSDPADGSGETPPCEPCEPAEPAWLFYTSGTTGRPKGAILSHRNLLAMTMNYFCDMDWVEPGEAIIHAAPLSHGSGLWVLPHVAKGSVHVVPENGFDPAEILVLLRAYRDVSMFAAPTMVTRLVNHVIERGGDTGNLKTITYGGGPMYVADLQKALATLGPKLVQLYGQGESPMTITGLSRRDHTDREHPRHRERLASVGTARTGCEVAVLDAAGVELPPGEIGEIVVRGDTVMSGYWNDQEASAEALRGGWLHTGDTGVFDPDGYLTLKDRLKDLIISGGSNIYPREVEEVLLSHPGVREVAVIGRPHDDWGEEVVAFVVPSSPDAVTEAELDALCLAAIARFKRPKRYVFLDSASEKQQRQDSQARIARLGHP